MVCKTTKLYITISHVGKLWKSLVQKPANLFIAFLLLFSLNDMKKTWAKVISVLRDINIFMSGGQITSTLIDWNTRHQKF